jgi:hypothetical protein
VKEPAIKSADCVTAKGVDIEGHPDSLANAPRVRLTGKKFYPVLEMLRFHWLPGTFAQHHACCEAPEHKVQTDSSCLTVHACSS